MERDDLFMRIFYAVDEIKGLKSHATIGLLQSFIIIATRPGVTVGEVQKSLGLAPTATARAVSMLFHKSRGNDGLGLVEQRPDPIDARIKHLFLTPRGERVFEKMKRHLYR